MCLEFSGKMGAITIDLGTGVVHTLEQGLRAVGFHIHQALADNHFARTTEVLLIDWAEVQGNLMAAHPERVAVVMGVGTGEEFQGNARRGADNTEIREGVVGASQPWAAVGFHQYSRVV